MSLWPSRGLILRGFEVKVSRSDFKREAKDPTKAEEIAKFCDEWWLVTPPGLIQDPAVELPPAWGLMVPNGKGGLKTVRTVTVTVAQPLTRGFVAAVLRKAQESVAKVYQDHVRRDSIQEQIDVAFERGKAAVPREIEFIKRDLERYTKRFQSFLAETGIDLGGDDWKIDAVAIGRAYRMGKAMMGTYGNEIETVIRCLETASKNAEEIRQRLIALPKGDKDEGQKE
jgi:hypothetical protein